MIHNAYWDFMARPMANHRLPTAQEMVPDFFLHTGVWTAIFVGLMILIPFILKRLYPYWYNSLNERKKEELPAYLTSMVHHLTVVPLAWYCIYNDFQVTDPNKPIDLTIFLQFAAPFCIGFVLADTIFYAVPLIFRGNFEYIIHHALALWMTYALLFGSGHFVRYFPHIVICDTTNGIFNFAWLLRLTGWKDSTLVSSMEIVFAVLFFFLRVINLSTVFGIMFFHPEGAAFGVARYAFPLISLLQFYWSVKIAQAMFKKLAPGKGEKSATPAKKVD